MRALLTFFVVWPIAVVAGTYEDGLRSLDRKSYGEAAAAFEVAAKQGNAAAERQIAFMYYRGNGFAQDNSKAVSWFESAATHGDLESQVNLGKLYENGLSVTQDDAKSAYWFRLAADQGGRRAQLRFGEICYLGTGVTRDRAEAAKWWRLATEPDDELSKGMREMIQSALAKLPARDAEEGLKRATEWKAARAAK